MTKIFKALKKSRLASSVVSVILAVSVLLSTFAGLSLFAADVWDGTIAESYASGSGSKADPFVIETAAELKKLVTDEDTEGKYFVLANDIYLNDTTNVGWAQNPDANKWVEPVTNSGVNFKGKFDGQGHKIYGLYIDAIIDDDTPTKSEAISYGAGLFPVVGAGAEITAVGIEGAYISVKNSGTDAALPYYGCVGGLVGKMNGDNIHISLCYQSEDTYLEGAYAGLIGYSNGTSAKSSTIVGCYSVGSATVPASKDAGFEGNRIGVLGANTVGSNAVAFDNCYAVGNVSGSVNQPLGSEATSYCTSNWGANVAEANVKNITGAAASSAMPKLDWETTYRTTTGYPILQVFTPSAVVPPSYDVWDGTLSSDGIKGSGTSADPYLIETPEQFAFIMSKEGKLSGQNEEQIKLLNDIYLNDLSAINWTTGTAKAGYEIREWTPHVFNGVLDGNGHMIYGLYVNTEPAEYTQLYSAANRGAGLVAMDRGSDWGWVSFKNLGMDKVYVDSANCSAAFVGTVSNKANTKIYFDSCYLGSDVTLKGYSVGGFVGGGGTGSINHGAKVLNSVSLVTRMTAKGGKTGAFFGDVWGRTYTAFNNTLSVGFATGNNFPDTYANVYTIGAKNSDSGRESVQLTDEQATGYGALANMPGITNFRSTDSYPVPAVLYSAITGLWDGKSVIPSKGGDGSSADKAVEIYTAAELAGLFSWGNKHGDGKYYKLMRDIYLNDIDAINWETGEAATGYTVNTWTSVPFKGAVDGNGHVIYGLYNDKNPTAYTENYANETGLGLISDEYTTTAVSFKNLGLDNVYFDGPHSVGAFVGNVRGDYGITFDSCYTGENVTLTGFAVGSFVAYGSKTVAIKNSYSLTTNMNVKAAGKHPGMLGSGIWSTGKTVDNSFSLNRVFGNGSATVTNSYGVLAFGESYPTVPADQMKGALAEVYMPNLDWEDHFVTTDKYPTLKVFAPSAVADDEIWDGSKIKPSEGSGSTEDPYLIYTAEEFAYALTSTTGSTLTACYKLMNDIYLNDITKINWKTGEVTDADYSVRPWVPADFAGTVDGNGHTVYGLYINRSAAIAKEDYANNGAALIAANWYNASANFEKLGLDKAYVRGANSSAGFAANAKTGGINIDRCYVGADVTVKGFTAAGMVAGAAGPIVITNSYSLTTDVTSTTGTTVAGILGNAWGPRTISNCYAVAALYDNVSIPTLAASYAGQRKTGIDTVLEPENMKGMDALTNDDKMPLLGYAFTATEGYPELCVFAGIEEVKPSEDPTVWDGKTVTKPSGSGTAMDPYMITNGAELAWAVGGNDNGKIFRLANDIKLNDPDAIDWTTGQVIKAGYVARTWKGGKFHGTIEGDGHLIFGLYINSGASSGSWGWAGTGLISESSGAVNIQMLGIENAYLCGANAVGVLVGTNNVGGASVTVSESFVGADVTVKGYSAGGFVGVSSKPVNVSDCYVQIASDRLVKWATVNEPALAGAFVGDGWGGTNITRSYSIAPITGHGSNLSACYFGTYTKDKLGRDDYQTLLTDAKMQGLDVLSNSGKMPSLGDKFYATEGYPTLRVFEEGTNFSDGEGEIWSGKIARTLMGSGTETDPYKITNGAELAFAISKGGFGGAYFVIENDIYLNDVTVSNWKGNASNKVWLSDTPSFNGHIDGQGHIVYGIWYPENHSGTASGLVPVFKQGTIENVGVRYAQIYGQLYAGGIVGRDVDQTEAAKTIRQCFADDTVYAKFTATSATHKEPYGGASGIVGYASPNSREASLLTIDTCYSKATLAGWDSGRLNGLIGTAWAAKYVIKDSYSYNYKPYSGLNKNTASFLITMGGDEALAGTEYVYEKVYTNTGAASGFEDFTTVSTLEMTDADAKNSLKGFDFVNTWETVFDTTPKLKVFKDYDGKATVDAEEASNFAGGAGTIRNPYIIKTVAQLRYLITSTNTAGKHYKLANDLYINDTTKSNWKVLAPKTWYSSDNGKDIYFEGTFDGDGHFIYGLYMNETPAEYTDGSSFIPRSTALFPCAKGAAVIKNVHIRNSYISGKAYAASIVGYIASGKNDVKIMSCSADTSVTIKGQTTGGLVGGGYSKLSLYYSYFTGSLSATAASVGRENGLVGDIWYTDQEVIECYTFAASPYRPGYTPTLCFYLYGTATSSGVTVLSEAQMTGANAKKYMADLDWDKVWTVKSGKTPHPAVIKGEPQFNLYDEGEKGRVWSGKMATKFAGGTGTEKDPYIIETPEQLAYLISLGEGATRGNHYKLVADLKMNDTSYSSWTTNARPWNVSSARFSGHFDGNGHVVSGLYYNGSVRAIALFPNVGGGAVIEKVGVTNSHLVSKVEGLITETYVASIIGYFAGGEGYPVISQCFADDSVYLEGHFVGGLVCGSPSAYLIDNCYFTGEITANDHHGTMIGNIWSSGQHISTITDSFSCSVDRNKISSNNGAAHIIATDYYHDGDTNVSGVKSLNMMFMKSAYAKEYMPGLDYQNIWMIVEGGTPVLRCFKNAAKYSCTRDPGKNSIAFVTGEGEPVEPIYGIAGWDKVPELPTTSRYGYEFGGWYFFEECLLPAEFDTFPYFDCFVYAKWIPLGFSQGFDAKIDEAYDFGPGSELYKPGVSGYNPKFIHGGLRSAHAKGDGENDAIFLVSYDNMLEIGKEYEMTFWMATDMDGATGKVNMLHANHGQYDSDVVGSQTLIEFEGLKSGEWKQYKVIFTANAPFMLFNVDKDLSLFFDDIEVTPTGKEGELGKDIEGFNPSQILTEPDEGGNNNTLVLVLAIVGGVILLAAIATVVIIFVKKGKKAKA